MTRFDLSRRGLFGIGAGAVAAIGGPDLAGATAGRSVARSEARDMRTAGADIPPGFASKTLAANGLHYVIGGSGPAVILVHGFPQTWYEYQPIMSRLAKRFTVIAVDLPGLGQSAPSRMGYTSPELAAAIHPLIATHRLDQPYLVGHDLGGIVSYAFVRRYPGALRGATILDVPVPGVAGWEESTGKLWHIGFIQTPGGLAERMVGADKDAFLGWCYGQGKFTPARRAYFEAAYGPAQLHAGFGIYRGFPADGKWAEAQTAANVTPLTIALGDRSFFYAFRDTFAGGFRARGMTHVESVTIPNSGHYVVADNPAGTADVIEKFAAR